MLTQDLIQLASQIQSVNNIQVYISPSTDPYFNLALEDYLFRSVLNTQPILYLWQNANSIVIGRAQNPWTECDLDKMAQDDVKLVRRQSGGGAVYHDLGNLNFTFLNPKNSPNSNLNYNKQTNLQIIINALEQFDISAKFSGRNDILVYPEISDPNGKKISGSAFRETKDKAFHHGTLLVNADLEKLGAYLTPPDKKLKSKGVKSVRSRVAILSKSHSVHGFCARPIQ
jgi:lipoate-protein ligase A